MELGVISALKQESRRFTDYQLYEYLNPKVGHLLANL